MTVTTPSAEQQRRVRRPGLSTTEVLAAGGVVAVGAAFLLSPDHIEDGPVLCPFRRLTGLPCPGCGLTRSWVYASHGWWSESFAAHPFGMVALAALVLLVVLAVVARVRRTAPPDLDRMAKHPVVVGIGAGWLVFALVRLASHL